MTPYPIRKLAAAAALGTVLTGLASCGGDDGAGVRELEGECPTSGSASGSGASGSETGGSASGSETSGSASEECETTSSGEESGSQ